MEVIKREAATFWTEIAVVTTWETAELVAEFLEEAHCQGVILGETPASEEGSPPLKGIETIVKGYLNSYSAPDPIILSLRKKLQELSQKGLNIGRGQIQQQKVYPEDWAHAWKAYFHPIEISPFLVVKPSWEHYETQPHQTIIEIDPGMAFGTGTHPTTQLCLRLLEKHLRPKATLLDVGCGSGILSILGAKKGAKVTAIDNDPVAVEITLDNGHFNKVLDQLTVHVAELKDIQGQFNLIVANILAEVIIEIAPLIPSRLMKGGLFIASGIIKAKEGAVSSALSCQGFQIAETLEQEGWIALTAFL